MKTKITVFTVFISLIAVVMFFSCDNPLALGNKLDINGPVVTITSPRQRDYVTGEFEIEGTARDDTAVDRLLIKASGKNADFPRQWRYQNGAWESTDNFGATWSPFADAEWNGGNKSGRWKISVDMNVLGQEPDEGEYTFNVQAWDKADFSDDNSFKAVALIVDLYPPKADVSYPFLYRGSNAYTVSPLKELHDITNTGAEKTNPSFLGKFLTQEFELKWQVEDINDVWSIDLRFYKYDAAGIDDDPDTPLPDTYIYKFNENVGKPPSGANPANYIKPNGSIDIPDLAGPAGLYDQGGDLLNPVTTKTTIKIVAVCYDAAGNANQEKTLGYFIYWPDANKPWIDFTKGMDKAAGYYGKTTAVVDNTVHTVFPSKYIKATAYQAHGIERVEYKLYQCSVSGGILQNPSVQAPTLKEEGTKTNTAYANKSYPNILALEFDVPPLTGYYILEATAYSAKNKPSETYEMLFRVNDITYPDFTKGPFPDASDPLFMAINNNVVTISGEIASAAELATLCLVWINPESEGYKAMGQLQYFREKNYGGWAQAINLGLGATALQNTLDQYYDHLKPNRLWRLNFTPNGTDPITNRRLYTYSQNINLTNDLKIGTSMDDQPLKSQVFLLRAENSSDQCTIITYAPQGDTLAPTIEITDVLITNPGRPDVTCIPGTYSVIPQFQGTETITINGRWTEDSLAKLDISYFTNNFEININNTAMSKPTLTKNSTRDGTWKLVTTVKDNAVAGQVPKDKLKDTLVIDVKTRDIGGNKAEIGSSWLVQSDNLKLMRISSETEDGTYTTNKQIEIFLEFSKPVKLANYNSNTPPYLVLSTTGGGTARAVYKADQTNQNSRQYFVYTVAAGQTTVTPEYLNVTGLYYNGVTYGTGTAYNTANYPFTWTRGTPGNTEYEEVRLTMQTGKTGVGKEGSGDGYYVRTLPTNAASGNDDYQYTLFSAKHIKIDTTAPVISSIAATSAAGWYNTGDIYVMVTFSEPVMLGATAPRLNLLLGTGGSTVQTSNDAGDVRVNGNTITFKYGIQDTNTSRGYEVSVTGYSGNISDLAGNPLATTAVTNYTGNKTLTGVYIETNRPTRPTVRVLSTYVNNPTALNQVVSQNVSGTTNYGLSTNGFKTLSNLYHDNLWLSVQPNTDNDNQAAPFKANSLEYSTNNGVSWVAFPNLTNTPQVLGQTGSYTVIARQKDKAGNVSLETEPITFTWDPGPLISRISSQDANGTYTHVSGRNRITLTVYFRKSLRIATTTTPQITLNARNSANNAINVTIPTASIPGGAVNSLTFNYDITNGDYTPTTPNTYLDITALSGITAWDGTALNNGVNVTSLLTTPVGTPKLDSNKQFKVETGSLTNTAPTFIEDNQGGTGYNDPANANFHGIRTDDGSYWTTLQIPFNHSILKGSGTITIQQIAGTGTTVYRMPAVITEAQYTRFKSNANTKDIIDNYYTKGINGYIDGTGSDTSNKYVLQYQYDTRSGTTGGFTGNAYPSAADFTSFRNAERIEINVNAQAVTADGSTLKIRLSGSSAPQVPGATYTVTYPAGLVSDELGNSSDAGNYNVALRGTAKPFVRIKKTQDTIAVNGNPSLTQPRLTAIQPFLANARIDCRTPGSTITYTATTGATNVTGNTPNTNTDSNNWSTNNGPADNTNVLPTRPANATATSYDYGTQITFGYTTGTTSPDINNVQGFQWWVRARASAGGTNSAETEEMANRTVITYQLRNANNAVTAAAGQSILAAGDQIWVRGGDAIGSSSIPGFPFTWEDNWSGLSKKRAGIRLMTLVDVGRTSNDNATTTMNNSRWRLVTWDMNATAYVDFIRGRDLAETDDGVTYAASSANAAWQYGPKRWAYQRDGWTSFKVQYPIYAGKHRWCDTGHNWGGKQAMNFSGTFSARPDLTADYDRWPGINTP
jgi:hypothetical protein